MRLWIVPGPEVAWFVLHGGEEAFFLEVVPPTRFLDALRAFTHATCFRHADVAMPDPADLLPWAGNV